MPSTSKCLLVDIRCMIANSVALCAMAINYQKDFSPNSTGSQGVIFALGSTPSIGSVIDGSIYYAGSTIQIQEIMDIQTSITNVSLVDVDLNWFEPKQYLGTYQIQSDLGLTRNVEDDGFLTSQYQRIIRYSYYTVVSDGQGAVALPNKSYVNDCNFDLRADIISNPPVVDIQRSVLDNKGDNNPIFTVDLTLSSVALADDRFYPKMLGVGLFLKPGVAVDVVRYRARAINGIRVSLPSFEPKVCSTRNSTTCDEQYAAYVVANPGSVFETFGACEAYRLNPPPGTPPQDTEGICVPDLWVCPSDENFTRPAFIIQYGN